MMMGSLMGSLYELLCCSGYSNCNPHAKYGRNSSTVQVVLSRHTVSAQFFRPGLSGVADVVAKAFKHHIHVSATFSSAPASVVSTGKRHVGGEHLVFQSFTVGRVANWTRVGFVSFQTRPRPRTPGGGNSADSAVYSSSSAAAQQSRYVPSLVGQHSPVKPIFWQLGAAKQEEDVVVELLLSSSSISKTGGSSSTKLRPSSSSSCSSSCSSS
mmetsp:Transcript_40882/g.46621  ORF Transcript_40882/g.46621 Transcript_40882/m.46621 type:complete len:212 (+) Transcript_40882:598-1233(+)